MALQYNACVWVVGTFSVISWCQAKLLDSEWRTPLFADPSVARLIKSLFRARRIPSFTFTTTFLCVEMSATDYIMPTGAAQRPKEYIRSFPRQDEVGFPRTVDSAWIYSLLCTG